MKVGEEVGKRRTGDASKKEEQQTISYPEKFVFMSRVSLSNHVRQRLWAPDELFVLWAMCKHLLHRASHSRWNAPAKLIVHLHKSKQVSALVVTSSTVKLLTSVKNAEVVQELNVACLKFELETQLFRDLSDHFKSLGMMCGQLSQRRIPRITWGSLERSNAVVADQLVILLYQERTEEARVLRDEAELVYQ